MKVLEEMVILSASAPITVYFKSLQNELEYVKPPIAIFVFCLVGLRLLTTVFQAVSLGFVMVFASLSQPYKRILVVKYFL